MTLVHHTGSKLLDKITADRDRRLELWWRSKEKTITEPASKSPPVFAQKTTREISKPLTGSPLNPRFTFDNFFISDNNRLASVEAQRAAYAKSPIYNPLYICGPVGLGKTHLLQAVAHAAAFGARNVLYLTADRFIYRKQQTGSSFQDGLRGANVFVVDDVQFLLGKDNQNEFLHIMDVLIEEKKQIVIAADQPPGDLEGLEERVRSRLIGGLCVEIHPLEMDLRVKILEARIADAKIMHQNFYVPAEVISYVAGVIQTNGRDLDGAVNRLLAHATLNGAPHSMETAAFAVRDLIREPERKKVKIEEIQKFVGKHYNVARDDMLSSRRTSTVVRPRQIAMYLSKVLTPRSLPEIGRRFGGRDHTTVLHGVRKITAMIAEDAVFAKEIEMLQEMLLS